MAAPENELRFDLAIVRAAGERWRRHNANREGNLAKLKNEGITAVESKERLARRANRLLDKVKQAMPRTAAAAIPEELMPLVNRGPIRPEEIDQELMERVIGETRDFLSIDFLDRALEVKSAVGRIVTRLGGGRVAYGTGFMVSPHLLLTNWHVLHDAAEAAKSVVEFDYQLDRFGNALTVHRFELDPATFFLNDKDLDFALCAVKATSATGRALKEFGYCPLIPVEGKIVIGDPVNIVQHPRGEMKQIALRENKLVDLPADGPFAHYECDTERGSSGSPVFNDEWEVVALHHSAIPRMNDAGQILDKDGHVWQENDDPDRIDWVSNEGIRVSRLVEHIKAAPLTATAKPLREELLSPTGPVIPPIRPEGIAPVSSTPVELPSPTTPATSAASAHGGAITITVPLTITLSLGGGAPIAASQSLTVQQATTGFVESVKPDPDYDNRPGYDPDFCGFNAPLPVLSAALQADAAQVNGSGFELKYYHYSAALNAKRRIAFFSVGNYDPDAEVEFEREGSDRWFFDPRIPQEVQAGEEFYKNNPLDRGHLVRRADAAWGADEDEAKLANDDTFHFTNCSPQHEIFNQSGLANKKKLKLWGNIENHIAEQAARNNRKISIYNGPVFRQNDRKHRGLQIPREFWKIVVFARDDGRPTALAFVLSQATLIKNLPAEEFEIGPYDVYQVSLKDLETKTKLGFPALKAFEPFEGGEESMLESATAPVPLGSLRDIRI
ncbi:MAG TPA: DNA/RNA non-specific endonuclease [Thermoanaerobaculia bacterium]|nr:DNA/RNA non-specific endonuclease [Thermoanaerobaculia bacterium]